jgi:pyridoxine 5-phosphate synthase
LESTRTISPTGCDAPWEVEPVRRLILACDSLLSLREATHSSDVDLAAAATLAELAGVDVVRLGIDEKLKPIRESDVQDTRRVVRNFELRMSVSPGLLKIALEARPDRVLLGASDLDGGWSGGALNLRAGTAQRVPVMRGLEEAGIPVSLRVPCRLDAIKAAHGDGATGVELYTGAIVDLPAAERKAELETLGDAVRLAAKLRLRIGIGGGLGYRTLHEIIDAVPAVEWIAVGRAAISRAVLVGLNRALRDLREAIQ